MDDKITLSIFQHTQNELDITQVLDMTADDICNLYYLESTNIKDEKGITLYRKVDLYEGQKGLITRLPD